jgi:hypothetical protein
MVFEEGLIIEDQLTMCDKVRLKFHYLRSAHNLIFEERVYGLEKPFSIDEVLE